MVSKTLRCVMRAAYAPYVGGVLHVFTSLVDRERSDAGVLRLHLRPERQDGAASDAASHQHRRLQLQRYKLFCFHCLRRNVRQRTEVS